MKTRTTRAVVLLVTGASAFATLGACGSDEVTIPAAAAAADGGASDGTTGSDGATVDGPGKVDDMCSFNKDCMAALRCECMEPVPCSCQKGVRGTGRNGIDPCPGDDGSNLCASAVCIEGPDGKGSFCSDECKTDADCTGMLPKCTEIDFVGRVCVRSS